MRPTILFPLVLIAACDGAATDPDAMSENEFLTEFEEKYCGQFEACMGPGSCDSEGALLGGGTDCSFDAAMAEECLASDFMCNRDGSEDDHEVLVPLVCAEAMFCE